MDERDPFNDNDDENYDVDESDVVTRGCNDTKFEVVNLPNLPEYYDKYSSLVTKQDPASVHTLLCRIFDSKGVDFHADGKSYIFHAVYANPGNLRECTFQVNFFASESNRGETFVEFQRRTGCSLAFNSLYREVSSDLGDKVRQAVPSTKQGFSAPNLSGTTAILLDEVNLNLSYTSAISEYVDEAQEGFCSLARDSAYPENARMILAGLHKDDGKNPTLKQVICSSLAAHDNLINRYSSVFLGNLVSHPDGRALHDWLVSDCFEPLKALLTVTISPPSMGDDDTRFVSLLSLETKRQMKKIFEHITDTNPQIAQETAMLHNMPQQAASLQTAF